MPVMTKWHFCSLPLKHGSRSKWNLEKHNRTLCLNSNNYVWTRLGYLCLYICNATHLQHWSESFFTAIVTSSCFKTVLKRNSSVSVPPKVLLLCRSWGVCVPLRSQRLCQLEFWLLVGTTMLDRLWARGQTKCNTPLMLATSVFGRIHRRPCYVMAQPKSRLDIPWPNDAECMGHVWYHFSCWYPLLFDVESLAGCVGG